MATNKNKSVMKEIILYSADTNEKITNFGLAAIPRAGEIVRFDGHELTVVAVKYRAGGGAVELFVTQQ